MKLLEPTMMVPPELEEPEDEELPLELDGDSPQEANKTANALIMMNVNFILFVIGLLLNLASQGMPLHFTYQSRMDKVPVYLCATFLDNLRSSTVSTTSTRMASRAAGIPPASSAPK